ncbi:hypothetical protein AC1031_021285 [Aphanomyces cochlioides]|nr:hypothetical protein AC1031_021285 [Aphanomyces cochlioides]
MSIPLPRQSAFADSLSALPPLKRDEVVAYMNYIDDAVDNAICLINGLGNIRWQPVKQKGEVVISRAADEANSFSNQAAVKSVCTVNASFEEMMEHFITETTDIFREREAAIHGAEFLDGAVLHVLHPRDYSSDDSPQRFVCIKWHCLKAVAAPTKPRDYVYVEVVDSFVDEQNVRIGYRLSKSIELKNFPSFEESHRFVRANTLNLHTFHSVEMPTHPRPSGQSNGSHNMSPSAQGTYQVELRSMVLGDYNGRLPAWVVNKMSDLAALRGQAIRDFFEQQRLSTLQWVPPHNYVPVSKRAFCVICTRGFSLVRKKYNCQACGEVVCNQCSIIQSIGPKKIKTRVCIGCNLQARTTQLTAGSSRSSVASMASRPSSASSLQSPNNSFHHHSNHNSIISNPRNSSHDSPAFNHSHSMSELSKSWGPSYRRSQSEMPTEQSYVRGNVPTVRPTSSSMPRTLSSSASLPPEIATSKSLNSEILAHASIATYQEPAPFEDLDLGLSSIKISDENVNGDALDLDLNVSIVQPNQQDYGRVSEALSDVTARNSEIVSERVSERMSERMSELDVDAYDDGSGDDDGKCGRPTYNIVEEESSSETAMTSFVESTATVATEDDENDDPVNYRPSHMAAEDYLEATRMTLAEITRGMQSVQESTELTALKLEEHEHEQVTRMSVMDHSRMSVMDHTRMSVMEPPRMSVMDTPPDVENLFVVLKLNAEIDRLQHKMETVQEGTIQLNQMNAAMNEKIHTLENRKVVVEESTEPPAYLMHKMDKINEDLKQIQHNMEKVQESTMAIESKLHENEPPAVEVPMLPESTRGGFVSFLEDSSFVPANEADAAPEGWTSVHSKVTGKMYYYNASCGQTSWTMPEEDDMAITENYAVL